VRGFCDTRFLVVVVVVIICVCVGGVGRWADGEAHLVCVVWCSVV